MSDEILGTLSDEEKGEFAILRKQKEALLLRIGSLEVEATKLKSQVITIDMRGQSMANSITARLGLPEGSAWSADEDGNIKSA